ncbi:NADPH-adrenodoxin reductase Arh1 [Xylogone sp. PMI_703]|nr:NADPH-adrenodoxin reductase Arh1 [Xylogone sp. PMI_703]
MHGFVRPWLCTRCAYSLKTNIQSRPRQLLNRSYTTQKRNNDKPFRLAVIGSGPAGFYTAYRVMSRISSAAVDMYEHLPVPYGLVRFGVAPDHPEVKNCEDKFQEVAASPSFRFIGNVEIGGDYGSLPLKSLIPHYDAILFSYGASKDRTLDIPGEDLKGVFSARAFVGWYNGLPEYADLEPDLTQSEEAVVIGQGNVALDVARILLKDPESLRSSDITETAIQALKRSKVKRVRVVGRRGPLQAAFTIKEVRELMKLPSVGFYPVDKSLIPADITKLPRAQRRIMEVLTKGSTTLPSSTERSWSLDFCLSPIAFNLDVNSPDRLGSIKFEKTTLVPDPFDLSAKASKTGELTEFKSSLAFRSIGYKSEALQGFSDLGIPFNSSLGVIPNDGMGRVMHERARSDDSSNHVPGLYCAGWVKRGPTGVIASTMQDAFSTADAIVEDWNSHALFLNGQLGTSGLDSNEILAEARKRGCRPVSWNDWQKIDRAEKERGKRSGKEREKFRTIPEMLSVID